MASVLFTLSNKKNTKGESVVLLSYRYANKQRLYFSTGEVIMSKHWSNDNQRVKRSLQGWSEINGYLDALAEEVKKIERVTLANNEPLTNGVFKSKLNSFLNKDKDVPVPVHGIIKRLDDYIKIHDKSLEKNTIKKFKTLKVHLTNFKAEQKIKLEFDNINLAFYQMLDKYLISQGLVNDTNGKYISALKIFLKWAMKNKYCSPIDLSDFIVRHTESNPIALTQDEMQVLYHADLSSNARLEQVRDVFCFSAYTGMRFKDVQLLTKNNIANDEITYVATKTKKQLAVPLNKFSSALLKKYKYILPVISNQKTNKYIKEVFEFLKLNRNISQTKFYGNETKITNTPLSKYIRFHSAKKTFITTYLQKGGNRELLKDIVGNTYKTMEAYISQNKSENKKEMQKLFGKPGRIKGG